jgi:hypothetical protein
MSWPASLARAVFDTGFEIAPASCRRFTLPDCLARWIDDLMPALGGVRSVSFHGCGARDLPMGPIMNLVAADGITLGDHVLIRRSLCPIDPCDPDKVRLLLHELVHVEQYRADPAFPASYVVDHLRFGYRSHPAEVAARDRAAHLLGAWLAETPCGGDVVGARRRRV